MVNVFDPSADSGHSLVPQYRCLGSDHPDGESLPLRHPNWPQDPWPFFPPPFGYRRNRSPDPPLPSSLAIAGSLCLLKRGSSTYSTLLLTVNVSESAVPDIVSLLSVHNSKKNYSVN